MIISIMGQSHIDERTIPLTGAHLLWRIIRNKQGMTARRRLSLMKVKLETYKCLTRLTAMPLERWTRSLLCLPQSCPEGIVSETDGKLLD